MCESLCRTSPLPSPEQKTNNPNISTPINSFITHPTGAKPVGPPAHIHAPLGHVLSQWGCETAYDRTACHNCCEAGNNKYYD